MAIRRSTNTTRTTSTSNVNTTNTAANNTATTNQISPLAPLRSASGEITSARTPVFNGLQGLRMSANRTTNRFSRESNFETMSASGDRPAARGHIKTDATPIAGGCRLNVKTFHQGRNENLTLYLMAEVFDAKTNTLRPITLSVLLNNQVANRNSYSSEMHFDIKYDDVNAFLKSKSPHLSLTPGQTNLAVSAYWNRSTHQAGGFQRGGVFRLPPSGTVTTVAAAQGVSAKTDDTDLPLDMQLAFSPQLLRSIPALKDDGNILSRLESELKGEASKAEMTSAITKMYGIVEKVEAGDKSGIQKMLGKDWTVETVNRYWLKDDGKNTVGTAGTGYFKGFRVDDDGLPIQDPMRDTYMDDDAMRMTQHEGAIRLRTNKQATVMNVKPGGGRLNNKTKICQRIEYGTEMEPGTTPSEAADAMRELNSYQYRDTIFNSAQKQSEILDQNLDLGQALDPWLEVVQDRHKFTLINEKTGVEIELSFDKVKAKTLRDKHKGTDGKAREVEFYVLEAELDHLQLNSNNTVSGAAVTNNSNTGMFSSDSQQDAWLSNLSSQATMNLDPRLHELSDLENESFRNTLSYEQFEKASAKLLPELFPNGLGHGRQKAAHAAEALGIVVFDDRAIRKAAKSLLAKEGYDWTPSMAKALQKILESDERQVLQSALHDQDYYDSFAELLDGEFSLPRGALKFSPTKLKARLKDRLADLGFDFSSDLEKILKKMTLKDVSPTELEEMIVDLESKDDDDLLEDFAYAVNVSKPATPRRNLNRFFEDDNPTGKIVMAAHVDSTQRDEIKDFCKACLAAGAEMSHVRSYLDDYGSGSVQFYTNNMGRDWNVTLVPTLKMNDAHVESESAKIFKEHFIAFDASLQKTMQGLADALNHDDMTQLLNELPTSRSVENKIKKLAEKHGVSFRPMSVDKAAAHATLSQSARGAMVEYSSGLKNYLDKALDQGVPVSRLETTLKRLAKENDLAAVAQKAKVVFTRSVRAPKVNYDDDAVNAHVVKSMMTSAQAMLSPSRFESAVSKTLSAGMTPHQSADFFKVYFREGRKGAVKKSGFADDKLPTIALDANAINRIFKKRFGTKFTSEHSKFVRAALNKALEDDAFEPYVLMSTQAKIMSALEKASGVKAPS